MTEKLNNENLISQLKKLEKNQKRLEDILNDVLAWIWEIDIDGKFTYSNQNVSFLLGYNSQEIIGNYFYDFFHFEDRQNLRKLVREKITKKMPIRKFESRCLHKDGKTVWHLTSGNPMLDKEENIIGYRFVNIDISDQRKSLEALRESEAHINSLRKSASNFAVYRLARDDSNHHKLKVAFVSTSAKEILGIQDPMKFETWFENIHPDDVESVAKANQDALDTMRFDQEYRTYNKKLSEYRWIHAISTGTVNENNWTGYVNGIMIDVTEKHRFHDELIKSQEHLRSLLDEASGFAVYRMVFDENAPYNLKMAACSPSYEKMTGIDPEKATVSDYYDNVHPDDVEEVLKAHEQAFLNGTFNQIARIYNPATKKYVWLHAISSAVKNKVGQITHVNGLLIDVTETQNVKFKLKKSVTSLKNHAKKQKELNSALNVLLRKRERDKRELEQGIILNIKEMVAPYLRKLRKSRLGDDQQLLLKLIDSNLKEITSQLTMKLSIPQLGLSPTEIKVANYVKRGKSSKDIAALLGVSFKTIKNQRNSIRKKLGITGKKINLRTYLLALDK
jgi:PAS domain S-box-containing protein